LSYNNLFVVNAVGLPSVSLEPTQLSQVPQRDPLPRICCASVRKLNQPKPEQRVPIAWSSCTSKKAGQMPAGGAFQFPVQPAVAHVRCVCDSDDKLRPNAVASIWQFQFRFFLLCCAFGERTRENRHTYTQTTAACFRSWQRQRTCPWAPHR